MRFGRNRELLVDDSHFRCYARILLRLPDDPDLVARLEEFERTQRLVRAFRVDKGVSVTVIERYFAGGVV